MGESGECFEDLLTVRKDKEVELRYLMAKLVKKLFNLCAKEEREGRSELNEEGGYLKS